MAQARCRSHRLAIPPGPEGPGFPRGSGDIEAWAVAYLDTGLHADDWMSRMAQQRKHFEKYQRTGDDPVDASMA